MRSRRFFFAATSAIASSSASGRDNDFGEDFDDFLDRRRIEPAVQGDNPAESGGRVAAERAKIGLAQIGRDRDPAGIGMFDDCHSRAKRWIEFGDEFEGGIRVVQIIIR